MEAGFKFNLMLVSLRQPDISPSKIGQANQRDIVKFSKSVKFRDPLRLENAVATECRILLMSHRMGTLGSMIEPKKNRVAKSRMI